MISDLATWSLAFHTPVCAFLWLAVYKLGGESKFGKQSQDEMKEIRGKLLRSIAASLAENLEPILTLANSIEVPKIIVAGEGEVRASPTITSIGAEKLRNAVRDFVKSDAQLMLALRIVDTADSCITRHLNGLRLLTFCGAIGSGAFVIIALLLTAQAFIIASAWLFIVAFSLMVLLFFPCVYCVLRVVLAMNCFERLKDKHGDLS